MVELLGGTRRWQKRHAGQRSSHNPGKESPNADHAALLRPEPRALK
jgi:hypothetical protein